MKNKYQRFKALLLFTVLGAMTLGSSGCVVTHEWHHGPKPGHRYAPKPGHRYTPLPQGHRPPRPHGEHVFYKSKIFEDRDRTS